MKIHGSYLPEYSRNNFLSWTYKQSEHGGKNRHGKGGPYLVHHPVLITTSPISNRPQNYPRTSSQPSSRDGSFHVMIPLDACLVRTTIVLSSGQVSQSGIMFAPMRGSQDPEGCAQGRAGILPLRKPLSPGGVSASQSGGTSGLQHETAASDDGEGFADLRDRHNCPSSRPAIILILREARPHRSGAQTGAGGGGRSTTRIFGSVSCSFATQRPSSNQSRGHSSHLRGDSGLARKTSSQHQGGLSRHSEVAAPFMRGL